MIKVFRGSIHNDKRGYLWTSGKRIKRTNLFSIMINFQYQKNVLRGLHGDSKTWKLISCVYGEIFFVVVNYDKKSKNFGKHKSFKLSHKNNQQILVPPNYLNGFLCLSENCVLHYKLSYREAILIMINKYQKSGAIKILI